MIVRYMKLFNYILNPPRSEDCKTIRTQILDDDALASMRIMHPDYPKEVKVITIFVRPLPGHSWIMDYLSNFPDLRFSEHDSDTLYGGIYYYRVQGNKVWATVVSTQGIWSIPFKYQGKGWYYVRLSCTPEDTRFDEFPGYEVAPASCYDV